MQGTTNQKQYVRRKQYVEVDVTHHIDGSLQPQKITLASGPDYIVEEVLKVTDKKMKATGEITKCYTIQVNGQKTCLYRNSDRWFVEMKERKCVSP